MTECKVCKKEFIQVRVTNLYCCKECRDKFHSEEKTIKARDNREEVNRKVRERRNKNLIKYSITQYKNRNSDAIRIKRNAKELEYYKYNRDIIISKLKAKKELVKNKSIKLRQLWNREDEEKVIYLHKTFVTSINIALELGRTVDSIENRAVSYTHLTLPTKRIV